ncbi:MAG TPA: hypothetical protein VFJ69_05245 [Actinomycetota bacterium]|nr:hypothetical protein [Actinomycetota bacterium]
MLDPLAGLVLGPERLARHVLVDATTWSGTVGCSVPTWTCCAGTWSTGPAGCGRRMRGERAGPRGTVQPAAQEEAATELRVAADEHRRITGLRLERLMQG